MAHIGNAIIVVGLAAVSAFLLVNGAVGAGAGWAVAAILVLFSI